MGRGVVLKFRTFPDGGRGVVCESSDVRKFLKKSKFQNFSELFKVKTRNSDTPGQGGGLKIRDFGGRAL